ncbi:double-stranded RNA-binding protein 4 isoform X2 [Jatropha curcas]|nr:double-stranded RNA-binding protein 4 isoform X2 [Jatropha curcas]
MADPKPYYDSNRNHAASQYQNPNQASASVPLLAQAPAPATSTVAASTPSSPHQLMHKNRLQEYTQKSSLQLPIYQTVNEGHQHAPRFRSTVIVDGEQYTSPNTFAHRKGAEQDAARVAMECILKKTKDEGCPLIYEDKVFCKSILYEYAVKMQIEKPMYNTFQPQGLFPIFGSTLVFNGVTYTGDTGRTKKEAEQLAARSAILSLMGNPVSSAIISEIIKSKSKLYASLYKFKESQLDAQLDSQSQLDAQHGIVPAVNKNKEAEVVLVGNNVPLRAIPQPTSPQPHAQNSTVPADNKSKEAEVVLAGNNVPPHAIPEAISGMCPSQPHAQYSNVPSVSKDKEDEVVLVGNNRPLRAIPQATSGMHHSPQAQYSTVPVVSEDKEAEIVLVGNNVPMHAIPQATLGMHPPHHEFTIRKQELTLRGIAFVQPVSGQPLDANPSSGRKRKKTRRKANKKMRNEPQ